MKQKKKRKGKEFFRNCRLFLLDRSIKIKLEKERERKRERERVGEREKEKEKKEDFSLPRFIDRSGFPLRVYFYVRNVINSC